MAGFLGCNGKQDRCCQKMLHTIVYPQVLASSHMEDGDFSLSNYLIEARVLLVAEPPLDI
jgi:hypothetical protein